MRNFNDQIFEILIRIFSDNIPNNSIEGAYLYCQTIDNQSSVFSSVQNLFFLKKVKSIFIVNVDSKFGFPGYSIWKSELLNLNIPKQVVNPVPLQNNTSLNTLIESEALVKYLKNNNIKSVIAVASPFQQPRAFMTAVTVANRLYPKLKIYSYSGESLPWNEKAIHSQGSLRALRMDIIKAEYARILTYQAKGDIASCDEVLDYLNKRDRRNY